MGSNISIVAPAAEPASSSRPRPLARIWTFTLRPTGSISGDGGGGGTTLSK